MTTLTAALTCSSLVSVVGNSGSGIDLKHGYLELWAQDFAILVISQYSDENWETIYFEEFIGIWEELVFSGWINVRNFWG